MRASTRDSIAYCRWLGKDLRTCTSLHASTCVAAECRYSISSLQTCITNLPPHFLQLIWAATILVALLRAGTTTAQGISMIDTTAPVPEVTCGWTTKTAIHLNVKPRNSAASSQGYGWTFNMAGNGQVCTSYDLGNFENPNPVRYSETNYCLGNKACPYTTVNSASRCIKKPLKCGTTYTFKVAYIQRYYGPMVLKNDAATKAQSPNVFDVLKFPSKWSDTQTKQATKQCSTLPCKSNDPEPPQPMVWMSYWNVGPVLSKTTRNSISIELKDYAAFGSTPFDKIVAGIYMWPSGSKPGYQPCQFNFNGKKSKGVGKFTIGKPSSFGLGWTGVSWSGSPDKCVKAALRCGTKYKFLMVFTRSQNLVHPDDVDTQVLEATTQACQG